MLLVLCSVGYILLASRTDVAYVTHSCMCQSSDFAAQVAARSAGNLGRVLDLKGKKITGVNFAILGDEKCRVPTGTHLAPGHALPLCRGAKRAAWPSQASRVPEQSSLERSPPAGRA